MGRRQEIEVRSSFHGGWITGFEAEVVEPPGDADRPRYRVRRRYDGVVLPELFDAADVRPAAPLGADG